MSSAQKQRIKRLVCCVTGSEKSPPGGETAPTTVTEPLAAAQRLHIAGALVELGQAPGQVGRIAFLGRHFFEAAGNLAQRFRPTRGGVGHQRHVVAHVAIILGDGDAGVDAGLARCHRHVRGIGDQDRALHQRPPAARIGEVREFLQHLGHLVAAFAAADVDDHMRICPFGDAVLGDRLAGAERARDAGRAALGDREECIQDALPGDERNVEPRGAGR